MTYENAMGELLKEFKANIAVLDSQGNPLSWKEVLENLDELVEEEGQVLDIEAYKIIGFIQDNYEEITGEDRSQIYAEQEFDYTIIMIAKACGISYDWLCEEW